MWFGEHRKTVHRFIPMSCRGEYPQSLGTYTTDGTKSLSILAGIGRALLGIDSFTVDRLLMLQFVHL